MSRFWKFFIIELIVIVALGAIFFLISRPEFAAIPFVSWLLGRSGGKGLLPKSKEVVEAEANIAEAETLIEEYQEKVKELKDKQIQLSNDLAELKKLGETLLGK